MKSLVIYYGMESVKKHHQLKEIQVSQDETS